ncbi:MAG: hypothetical protein EXR77_01520 [Myxococcales bacterium]|nr:hypothetical protein [Myxococcales bacterium]
MSEDLLNKAARALRQSTDDGQAGPTTARMHILARAQHQRVRGERRAAVAMALSAVLVTSTAIAAATGALPSVVAAVQRAVGMDASAPSGSGHPMASEPESAARLRLKKGKGPAGMRPAVPASEAQAVDIAMDEPLQPASGAAVLPSAEPPAPVSPAPASPAPVSPAPASPAPASPVSAPPAQAGTGGSALEGQPALTARLQPAPAAKPQLKAPKTAAEPAVDQPATAVGPQATAAAQAEPVVVAAPTAPPDAPPDETLVLFRAAQALQHRDKNYAKALAAWEGYLHAAPAGVLAPEARWNRAICLLRLGRKPQARMALEHFAHGAEGGYRQAEATKLLAALEGAEP